MPVLLRAEEAHREQHEVAVELELAAGNLDHLRPAVRRPGCHSRRTPCSFFTLPSASPLKRLVLMLQSRMTPSSCELERAQDHRPVRPRRDVRRCAPRAASAAARTGAPTRRPGGSRCRGSREPVSPPPRMTTCLPVAQDLARHACRRRPPCSAAAGSPSRSGCPAARGPGSGRSRGCGRAAGEHDGVELRAQLRRPVTSTPTLTLGAERRRPRPPSAPCGGRSRCFSILKSGMP